MSQRRRLRWKRARPLSAASQLLRLDIQDRGSLDQRRQLERRVAVLRTSNSFAPPRART